MPPDLALRTALVGLYSLVVVALFVAVPVVVWRARPLPAGILKPAAAFAAAVFALQLPGILVYAAYYDPRALFDGDVAPPFVEAMVGDVAQAMLVASVVSAVVLGVWRIVVWAAARVAHNSSPFPWLHGRSPRPWGSAIALGLGLGLVGVALNVGLGMGQGLTQQAPELFPGLPTHGLVPFAVAASSGMAAALGEELLFRGVFQRLLLGRLPAAAAITVMAIAVGCGQALAPELPWVAMVRAGAFAAALGTLAQRHGLECSILAHTVLALVVATGTLVP